MTYVAESLCFSEDFTAHIRMYQSEYVYSLLMRAKTGITGLSGATMRLYTLNNVTLLMTNKLE